VQERTETARERHANRGSEAIAAVGDRTEQRAVPVRKRIHVLGPPLLDRNRLALPQDARGLRPILDESAEGFAFPMQIASTSSPASVCIGYEVGCAPPAIRRAWGSASFASGTSFFTSASRQVMNENATTSAWLSPSNLDTSSKSGSGGTVSKSEV
jgi:hypothetical protein